MSDKKPNVLVIDDDPQIRSLLEQLLKGKGCSVTSCASAQEGLSVLYSTGIELVLLDICMPETDGVEMLKKIKSITSDTRVIMITGLGDIGTAEECMKLGATDFITKPFDFEYLETSVLSHVIPLS